MSENLKNKEPSLLVKSVTTLDRYFNEVARLGAQIESMELISDFDISKAQTLMNRFAKCAEAISEEVPNLSNRLNEARVKAEAAAQVVSVRAVQLHERNAERQQKLEEFGKLGENVRELSAAVSELKSPDGGSRDSIQFTMRLSEIELRLQPLIEQAQKLKKEAQSAKMGILERNADSLSQSLVAVSQKLSAFNHTNHSAQ